MMSRKAYGRGAFTGIWPMLLQFLCCTLFFCKSSLRLLRFEFCTQLALVFSGVSLSLRQQDDFTILLFLLRPFCILMQEHFRHVAVFCIMFLMDLVQFGKFILQLFRLLVMTIFDYCVVALTSCKQWTRPYSIRGLTNAQVYLPSVSTCRNDLWFSASDFTQFSVSYKNTGPPNDKAWPACDDKCH